MRVTGDNVSNTKAPVCAIMNNVQYSFYFAENIGRETRI